MGDPELSSLETCKETECEKCSNSHVRSFFVSSTWLLLTAGGTLSLHSICGLTTGAGWTQGLDRPWQPPGVGGGSASGGVRRTAAGTSQQWPAVEMGPGEGRRVGASFQHSSQKERAYFPSSVCKRNWNKAGGLQEAPVLEERTEC